MSSNLTPTTNNRKLNATLEGSMKEVPMGLLPLTMNIESVFTTVKVLVPGLKLSLSLLVRRCCEGDSLPREKSV